MVDDGCVQRKNSFDADAETGLAHRDGLTRAAVLARTLFAYLIMRSGIKVGGFVPRTYVQQVVENSAFRKYDDGLRMIIDCTPDLAQALERRLTAAAGTALYGLHRQRRPDPGRRY